MFKAEFSDGSSFSFSKEYLPDGLEVEILENGQELRSGDEEALRFAALCYQVEKAALKLIARAEQNSLALKAKLGRRGFGSAEIKAVIYRLLERNLLNDERYAEHWLNSRLPMEKTPKWLLVSLRKRGIDRDSSLNALKKILNLETEYALLLKHLEKLDISENKRTLKSYLRAEGFSPEVLNLYFDML